MKKRESAVIQNAGPRPAKSATAVGLRVHRGRVLRGRPPAGSHDRLHTQPLAAEPHVHRLQRHVARQPAGDHAAPPPSASTTARSRSASKLRRTWISAAPPRTHDWRAGLAARHDSHERRLGARQRPRRPPSPHQSPGPRRRRGLRPVVRRRRRHPNSAAAFDTVARPVHFDQLRPLLTRVVPPHPAMVPAPPAARHVRSVQRLRQIASCARSRSLEFAGAPRRLVYSPRDRTRDPFAKPASARFRADPRRGLDAAP